MIESAIEEAKEFGGAVDSMAPEDRQEQIAKFMDDGYMFGPDVQREMQRIDDMPEAADYIETVGDDFDRILGPLMEEFGNILQPIIQSEMDGALGEMFGDIGNALGDAFGDSEE